MGETEVTQGQWKKLMDGETVENLDEKAFACETKFDYLKDKTLKDFLVGKR